MRCLLCGSENNIIQHHIDYENDITVPLCRSCHSSVHHNPTHPLCPDGGYIGRREYVDENPVLKLVQRKITIPKECCNKLGVSVGDWLICEIEDGEAVLKPLEDYEVRDNNDPVQ